MLIRTITLINIQHCAHFYSLLCGLPDPNVVQMINKYIVYI